VIRILTSEGLTMVIEIDMNTGEICYQTAAADTDYEVEVLCSGWNPAVEELRTELHQHEVTAPATRAFPPTLAEAPLDAFLDDMQAL